MVESKTEKEEDKIFNKVRTLIDGDRIINFSDAVFAFSATLLILKIDLPNVSPELIRTNFYEQLIKLIPIYGANFFSFLIIGYYWRAHHKLFILIKRYDNILIWLNTLMLISVALLPFPIDVFGQYSEVPEVVAFYSASLAVVGFMLLFTWLYAAHKHKLIDKEISRHMVWYFTISNAIAPIVFTLSIPLAYIDDVLAKISWLFVIVFLVILNNMYKITSSQKKNFDKEPV